MSDGPHKSLPMRRAWKRLAEVADNCNYAPDEVAASVPDAVIGDWRLVPAELLRDFERILEGKAQAALFGDQAAERLENLKRLAAGKEVAHVLIEFAQRSLAHGKRGAEACIDAAAAALKEAALRNVRSVEEHYLRESSKRRAMRVRERLEVAISKIRWRDIARSLFKKSEGKAERSSHKKSGLDEGVPVR